MKMRRLDRWAYPRDIESNIQRGSLQRTGRQRHFPIVSDKMPRVADSVVVGVDLGGTNLRAAAFDESGNPVGPRIETPSYAKQGSAKTIDAITQAIQRAKAAHRLGAVGMAVPGHIDGDFVRWAPNFGETINGEFRCYRNVDLAAPIREAVNAPVVMGNDANVAALGEYYFGSGKGKANGLVLITIGTGIGTGIVLSPSCVAGGLVRPTMLVGGNGGGVEFGHVIIVKDGDLCTCGAKGCAEAYLGTTGLLRRAMPFIPEDIVLTPKILDEFADNGHEGAIRFWKETGEYLGILIGNFINGFAPQIIAIGGQIAKAHQHFLPTAIEIARRNAIPTLWSDSSIVLAERLDDAGLLGAATLAWDAIE